MCVVDGLRRNGAIRAVWSHACSGRKRYRADARAACGGWGASHAQLSRISHGTCASGDRAGAQKIYSMSEAREDACEHTGALAREE